MPRFLYSFKSCHSCAKRSGCDLKNSSKNLIGTPKVFDHMARRLMRHGVPSIKRISFCRDYEPEKELNVASPINPEIKFPKKFIGRLPNKPYPKPVMLTTPFNYTKELIRKEANKKASERK